jgi:predicted metal-binding protein
MDEKLRIGIIICDRYKSCAGGKCFRAFRNREGAFGVYKDTDAEIAGFTSCGGCPGGNIEYTGEEMVKNGVRVIHLATGLVVGYPPCRNIDHFVRFMEERYKVKVLVGTHPIPEKYRLIHDKLGTWKNPAWAARLAPTMADEGIRKAYD